MLLSGTSLDPLPAGDTVTLEISVFNVTIGVENFFAVRAVDNADNEGDVSTNGGGGDSSVLVADTFPPSAISDLTVMYQDGTVAIAFTAPGDDGDIGIGEYSNRI